MSLKMSQIIFKDLSLVFPHTCARLAHWHLVIYSDTVLLHPQNVFLAILPYYLYQIEAFAIQDHLPQNDRDDERPPQYPPGPFRVLLHNIKFWFFVYEARELVAALEIVLRTPGICGKVIVALDLAMESTLVLLPKILFFVSIGLFVGAAIQGLPFLTGFFTSAWMFLQECLQLVYLDLVDPREELRGRIEVPADGPLREE